MTKQEKIIVSAYTGILMCDFDDMRKYIEEKMQRQVFTHELADEQFLYELKARIKSDFIALCKED